MTRIALFALGLSALVPLPAIAEPVEVVAEIRGAMPTGITVTPGGRVFLNFPQWGDGSPFAVAELIGGRLVPFPDTPFNRSGGDDPVTHLLSVQSVVADGADRLWILDTGAPGFAPPVPGGAKLVAVDLGTGDVVRTITFRPDVVLPSTYLNDVRLDFTVGEAGVAYITDSSLSGPGAIIVVDLATGEARRRLSGHASTMPDPDFVPVIDGEPLMVRPPEGPASPWRVASDGIAISPDGETLYYCALSSRRLHAVPTALLRDPDASDAQIAAAVRDLGEKGASDGLAEDDLGRIYAGDYENDALRRWDGRRWTTIAQDPLLDWPDTLSVGPDGYLYVTANQLERQAPFHGGIDRREQPYRVLRVPIGAGPVHLD
ncbi:major royal jelly family protein [Acuticoccus sp. I52.16.1]|uniref:major royal jelly family protein n=1 Tax=Acuticoccus sp. I52.16.1 TaxID=2928472 RepID=UPI001FD3FDFB|nr:major royal jelly family protein [Acuticoccus sp. I52.16.1]UOM36677.1 major royal jelly family protein [Acuticoccus sp. I52.16.1]